MKKNYVIITECFKCGARYENHFTASPCCKSIMMKVNANGERTTITYLNSFIIPKPDPVKK
jgi:uncharacterized OB-fold protein